MINSAGLSVLELVAYIIKASMNNITAFKPQPMNY